jgi:hypothetical protein
VFFGAFVFIKLFKRLETFVARDALPESFSHAHGNSLCVEESLFLFKYGFRDRWKLSNTAFSVIEMELSAHVKFETDSVGELKLAYGADNISLDILVGGHGVD